jgi:hypothetical protein
MSDEHIRILERKLAWKDRQIEWLIDFADTLWFHSGSYDEIRGKAEEATKDE